MTKRWRVELTAPARQQFAAIRDRRIQRSISASIDRLTHDPEQQGKPLIAELAGFRSIRVVEQRWRIIYQVNVDRVIVYVVTLGIRKEGDKKDVYELARKLLRARLLGPD
jgi:mRNA interferase RelE/StbE